MCVSQWTVDGAAGPCGAHAVELVMLVSEGGIVQEPILLQLLEVVPVKETELGLIHAALNPALVHTQSCYSGYKQITDSNIQKVDVVVMCLKV